MHAATNNFPSRQTLIRALIIGALSTTLVACGGGGPGGADLIAGGSSGKPSTTPAPSTSPAPIPASGRITVTLSKATLALGDVVQVTATMVDANNQPVKDAIVHFATDEKVGLLSAPSGITKADGTVTTTLSAAGVSASGLVAVLAVTSKYNDVNGTEKTVNNSTNYQVSNVALQIDTISSSVASGDSMIANTSSTIDVIVSANGKPILGQIVNFTSQCAQSNKASIDATATTLENGKATATFTDKGCGPITDKITATLASNKIATKTTDIKINAQLPGSLNLNFSSMLPADGLISLKGYSVERPETAQVQFKLTDIGGKPMQGKTIKLSLGGNTTGGVSLLNAINGIVTTQTLIDGTVTATVQAGNYPTPVSVTAEYWDLQDLTKPESPTNPKIYYKKILSNKLTISSGFPDQDSLDLSADKRNINGLNYSGATATITMRLADHFNNPVPTGTAINFLTDSGSIDGSCLTKLDSNNKSYCTVQLVSQAPRKSNGRVNIVAFATGEESFTDKNSNIVADSAVELFDSTNAPSDIGGPFIDTNENDVFNQGIDQGVDGSIPSKPDGKLNAKLCTNTSTFDKCSSQTTLKIYKQATFIFSGDNPVLRAAPSVERACNTEDGFVVNITDEIGNTLPAGTSIAFGINSGDGKITSGASQTVSNNTTKIGTPLHPLDGQKSPIGATWFSFGVSFGSIADDGKRTCKSGTYTITVSTPADGGIPSKITTLKPLVYTIQ